MRGPQLDIDPADAWGGGIIVSGHLHIVGLSDLEKYFALGSFSLSNFYVSSCIIILIAKTGVVLRQESIHLIYEKIVIIKIYMWFAQYYRYYRSN